MTTCFGRTLVKIWWPGGSKAKLRTQHTPGPCRRLVRDLGMVPPLDLHRRWWGISRCACWKVGVSAGTGLMDPWMKVDLFWFVCVNTGVFPGIALKWTIWFVTLFFTIFYTTNTYTNMRFQQVFTSFQLARRQAGNRDADSNARWGDGAMMGQGRAGYLVGNHWHQNSSNIMWICSWCHHQCGNLA
jgi:hypothetical protein